MNNEKVFFYDWQVQGDYLYDWEEQLDFSDTIDQLFTFKATAKVITLRRTSNVVDIASHPNFHSELEARTY